MIFAVLRPLRERSGSTVVSEGGYAMTQVVQPDRR
jgi:hypothetical protein